MGAFRIHELLARTESVFEPIFTLLTRDLQVMNENKMDNYSIKKTK